MKLLSAGPSPFVRKVLITLHETGQLDEIERVQVTASPLQPDPSLTAANPVGKIPALIREDGPTLYDSRVICRYLDHRAGTGFYPEKRLWDTLTLEATADGIMDAAVLIIYEERFRPEEKVSIEWIEGQWAKVSRALDAVNTRWMSHLHGPLDMGQIGMGAALGYLDFRHDVRSWRTGREVLKTLWEREFPASNVIALASKRSVGAEVSYGEDEVLQVQDLADFDFSGVDIVLSSPGAKVSAEFSPKAAAAGAVVIDNTSHFRMDPDVPLIVPEVNADAIIGYKKKGIIANPNCSTIQMVVALKPLHEAYGIKRVVVSTYQSTSGAGKDAMDELFNQTKGIYVNQATSESQEIFPKQIAFNVIPHIDTFMDDGATKEEWKMMVETKKILGPKIKVHANCARVPTFIGHAEYVNIETEKPIDDSEARKLLKKANGVSVVDHRLNEGYVTPAEVPGEDAVYVSRIRSDATVDNGLSFWCVSDNLRKGAALNAVQIAEALVRDYLSVKG